MSKPDIPGPAWALALVSDIRSRHRDFGTATLHGTPPGDWFQTWMADVAALLAILDCQGDRQPGPGQPGQVVRIGVRIQGPERLTAERVDELELWARRVAGGPVELTTAPMHACPGVQVEILPSAVRDRTRVEKDG